MRDNSWLQEQLDYLLKTHFKNVKITNPIQIRFGREARFRFGSIRLVKPKGYRGLAGLRRLAHLQDKKVEPDKSIITITAMFAKEDVPVEVVQYTIGHELSHYAHGFSSANKQMFRHPHHGGIVNKELNARGAGHLTAAFKKWLKEYKQSLRSSSFI